MRAIQKISITNPPDRTKIILSLPKNSTILDAELFDNEFIFWFDGVADEHVGFDVHTVGIFRPEEAIPDTATIFIGTVKPYIENGFLFEYVKPV